MTPPEPISHQIIKHVSSHSPDATGGALELWEKLAMELISIVGEHGFHSLFLRSIYLNEPNFPWLADMEQQSDSRFAGLMLRYEQRDSSEVAAANHDLLVTLIDTLTSVIGESLTLGILRAAWRNYALDTVEKEFPK